MGDTSSDVFETLAGVAAVVTLPAGILAAMFVGGTAAGVVFVVGWLLLVPLFGMLSDRATSPEEVNEWVEVAEAAQDLDDGDTSEDPLEALRERYARGELDEAEFERKLERLVATEEIPDHAVSDDSFDDVDGERDRDRSDAELERTRE